VLVRCTRECPVSSASHFAAPEGVLVRRRCSASLKAGAGWFECPRPPRHATRRLRALDDSVSLAADSPPLPEGSRKPTRHSDRTRMGALPNPRRDLPKDSRTDGEPRSTQAWPRLVTPTPQVRWCGSASGQTDIVSIEETARTEILSLTRRPSSRRKRRGRGWITHALCPGLLP